MSALDVDVKQNIHDGHKATGFFLPVVNSIKHQFSIVGSDRRSSMPAFCCHFISDEPGQEWHGIPWDLIHCQWCRITTKDAHMQISFQRVPEQNL